MSPPALEARPMRGRASQLMTAIELLTKLVTERSSGDESESDPWASASWVLTFPKDLRKPDPRRDPERTHAYPATLG